MSSADAHPRIAGHRVTDLSAALGGVAWVALVAPWLAVTGTVALFGL